MVAVIGSKLEFPPAHTANRDGLVAVGGDLSIDRLLLAYRNGIFPWPLFARQPITWFSPDPRAILELDALHVSRSLAKFLRKSPFRVSVNEDFAGVIRGCASHVEDRPSTWITPQMLRAYIALHKAGHAHSVEVWFEQALVGGLYGIAIGGAFAGESMFSRVPNASKVALVHLVERLRQRGYVLLDTQQATTHMRTMGATTIPRKQYLERLAAAIQLPVTFV